MDEVSAGVRVSLTPGLTRPVLPPLLRAWWSRVAIFLEAVHEQTHVAPKNQEYLFEGHLCALDPSLSAQHIAHTTASSPLMLFSVTAETPKGLAFRDRE